MDHDGRRLQFLDGCRALAVLGVILYHTVSSAAWGADSLASATHPNATWWLTTICAKGAHGVDLFFVLSGFCLSYPYLRRARESGHTAVDVASFLTKRVVRIVPPFYVAALGWFVVPPLLAHFGIPVARWVNAVDWPSEVKTLLFLDRKTALTDTSFWTLFVEMRWYLFFPMMLALYVRNVRAFYALLVACVIAFWFTTLRAIDIGVLPGFMLGIVAADWFVTNNPIGRYASLLAFVAFDVALFLEPYASTPSRSGGGDMMGTFVQTNIGWQLFSFFFVVWAGRFAPLRALLSAAPLRAVGVATYSIYLVHQPLAALWAERIAPSFAPVPSLAGAIAISLGCGWLFWFVAERPFCTGPLRAVLVSCLHRRLVQACSFCGVPERFIATLTRTPRRAHESLSVSRGPAALTATTNSSR